MKETTIKEAIEKRGLSIKRFAALIGIPATTLQSALEKTGGIDKMKFSSVAKICDALNLDLKTFKPINIATNILFESEDEMGVMEMYRNSETNVQEAVKKVMESFVESDESKRGA
jgi:DNA-binding Xre family transcriptional regulator